MALGIVAAGTGSPVGIASLGVPGVIEADVAPSGTYAVALTEHQYPHVGPLFGGGMQISGTDVAVPFVVYNAHGTTTFYGDGIRIDRSGDHNGVFDLHLAAGASGDELSMVDSLGASLWAVDETGTQKLGGSLGINGIAPPGFPVLATGASHTVDDVITLLQSYGFCKQS